MAKQLPMPVCLNRLNNYCPLEIVGNDDLIEGDKDGYYKHRFYSVWDC